MNVRRCAVLGVASCAFALVLSGMAFVGCASDALVERRGPDTDAESEVPTNTTDAQTPDGGKDAAVEVPACSVDGWCYTTLPSASSFDAGAVPANADGPVFAIQSVWLAPDHHAWAVTAGGHVLHWDGSAWKVEFTASAPLRSIWGTSSSDIWLTGDRGLVVHATGGAGALTFQVVDIKSSYGINRVWGTSSTDVWLLGSDAVYHLTAETASTTTPFVATPIPSAYGDPSAYVRVTAISGTASDTWFSGKEFTDCAPPKCGNGTRPFAARRTVAVDGVVSWGSVALPVDLATAVVSASATKDGVQTLAIAGNFLANALVARVATDASKLDSRHGSITVDGAFAWNSELAQNYSLPTGLWGTGNDDMWLVGGSGVVRHFDGSEWQVVRVARTKLAPLIADLRGIDGRVEATGERDMWIVGDDVAMHRTVNQ